MEKNVIKQHTTFVSSGLLKHLRGFLFNFGGRIHQIKGYHLIVSLLSDYLNLLPEYLF